MWFYIILPILLSSLDYYVVLHNLPNKTNGLRAPQKNIAQTNTVI